MPIKTINGEPIVVDATGISDDSITDAKLATDGVKLAVSEAYDNLTHVAEKAFREDGKMPAPSVGKTINATTGASKDQANRMTVGRMRADAIEVGSTPCNIMGYTSATATLTTCFVGRINAKNWVTDTIVVIPENIVAVVVVFDTTGHEDPASLASTIKRLTKSNVDAAKAAADYLAGGARSVVTNLNDWLPDYEKRDYNSSGIPYKGKGWRIGQWSNGFNGSNRRMCCVWNLISMLQERPDAIRVQILDDTELEYPLIYVGSTTSGQSLYYGVTNDVVVSVPSEQTTLAVTIGSWASMDGDDYTIDVINHRIYDWASANVRITAYFGTETTLGRYVGLSTFVHSRDSSITLSYKYDSSMEYALKLPDTYTPDGEPTPLILFCHGYAQDLDDDFWSNDDAINMINGFAVAGYATLDVNETAANHYDWCNPDLFAMYLAAIKDVTEHYNVRLDYMYADSMGGLNCLWLQQLLRPKACVITGLRLDFEARWPNFTEPQQAQILANFGIEEWDQDFMKQWFLTIPEYEDKDGEPANPNHFAPTLYIYGESDSYISESLAKVDAMRRGGSVCEVIGYANATHHAVCYLTPEGALDAATNWFGRWSW